MRFVRCEPNDRSGRRVVRDQRPPSNNQVPPALAAVEHGPYHVGNVRPVVPPSIRRSNVARGGVTSAPLRTLR